MIRNGSQRHWSVHLLAMVLALSLVTGFAVTAGLRVRRKGTAVLAYVVKHPGSALLHIARAVRRNMAAWRAVASVSVPALGKLLRNRVR